MLGQLASLSWPYSFFQYFLKHVLVEREVGHQLFELLVLGFELAETT